jgi:hypothetical protein
MATGVGVGVGVGVGGTTPQPFNHKCPMEKINIPGRRFNSDDRLLDIAMFSSFRKAPRIPIKHETIFRGVVQ